MLKKINRLRMNQRGDTLVEVLVAIAIVSSILAGAFVVSNRSQQGVRNSQEHAEALKLIESQVEQLRSMTNSGMADIFTQSGFCVAGGEVVSASQAACTLNSAGQATTAEPEYHLSIARTDSQGGSLFAVTAAWDQVTGGKAQEQISYRLYQ